MRVFVINLEESAKRWADFAQQNKGMAYERFNAVTGAEARDPSRQYRKWFSDDLRYTDGAFGNAASHVSLWHRCIESDETITVVEDDAILIDGFNTRAESIVKNMKQPWDVILWGWNFDSVCQFSFPNGFSPCIAVFDQKTLRAEIESFQLADYQPNLFKLDLAMGTVGYTINPAGAARLIEMLVPLKPSSLFLPVIKRQVRNRSLDIALSTIYPDIDAYCTFPPLIATKNEREASTVQTTTELQK